MDSELRRRDLLGASDSTEVPALPHPTSLSSRTLETAKILAYFVLYSTAMFTLPFVAYVGTKYGLKYFGVEGFANTAWSVLAAVVVVNTIIMLYACKGYQEEMESAQQESEQQQCKTDHDLKAD
jgi:VMA21-like domain.